MKLIIHIIIRLIGLYTLVCIGAWIGLITLASDRKCGTGDGLAISLYVLLFYFLGIITLVVESYSSHNKKEIKKRNANLSIIIIPPVLMLVIGLILINN